MSADKRSVATDALLSLGTIHTQQEYRDAIHLAVEPVKAGCTLHPGDHVFLSDGMAYPILMYRVPANAKAVGIVDPFLETPVAMGQSFWLVVYPRKITSLRHVWSHPDFDTDVEPKALPADKVTPPAEPEEKIVNFDLVTKDDAYAWISEYADSLGSSIDAEELIEYGTAHISSAWGEYLVKGGDLEGVATSEEFWDYLAIYIGREIPMGSRSNFFSCSCG